MRATSICLNLGFEDDKDFVQFVPADANSDASI